MRRKPLHILLRWFAFALLFVYAAWNVLQLSMWRLPPSLLVAFTGIPCPTTGGTRAMVALWHGDVATSLQWNPLAVPIAALTLVTVVYVISLAARRKRLRLSNGWLFTWLGLLAIAWGIQLTRYFSGTFPSEL